MQNEVSTEFTLLEFLVIVHSNDGRNGSRISKTGVMEDSSHVEKRKVNLQ
jgi:hypothetical protein